MASRSASRFGYGLGFIACVLLLAFALYLQYYQNQDPCPLCIFQRVAYLALGVLFLIAALHGPRRIGARVYGVLLFIAAIAGLAVAARQVWLQHLPAELVPECGPGLNYMLHRFPLGETLRKVLSGSGECAQVNWTFLHLSIAEWSLICFVLFVIYIIWITRVAARRPAW